MQLSDKALLVQLNVSQWTARKLDKRVTKEVADTHGANRAAGNYHKRLLPVNNSLETVHTKTSLMRADFYKQTLPWGLEGTHMLPSKNYLAFMSEFRKHKAEWDILVGRFLWDYEQLLRQAGSNAQSFLGGLYDPNDYPPVEVVKQKFKVDMVVLPVPTNDFRVQISDSELAGIHADVQRRVQESVRGAMDEAWNRLYKQVSTMAQRLGNPEGKLYDSLIDNARELCTILTRLNVTDDPDLEAMRQEVEAKLTPHDKDVIKADPKLRQSLADEAAEIMKRMGAFMGQPS